MKKNIFIICTVISAFGLMAFGYMKWNNTGACQKVAACSKTVSFGFDPLNMLNQQADLDLIYKVDSRFGNTITKENLQKARSIVDILPSKATQSIVAYYSSTVSILEGSQKTDQQETGKSEILNGAQINLLQSTDYSTEIFIGSDYKHLNGKTGNLENGNLTYYISIIPEKEAEYVGGYDALIDYLKKGSRKITAIIKEDQLKPGRVNFTVTKEGTIANAKLTSTSGYPSVDETLVELIRNMPRAWNAATNSKGEKVDQELVFFFGLEGC